jgi:hypothetical protein
LSASVKRFGITCLLLLATLLAPFSANAAGGADIVDDSEPETPGMCHLETWVSLSLTGDSYLNEGPACTTTKLPWLEIGAAYQQYWGQTYNAPLFGPAIKVNLQHASTGLGVGLSFNGGVNLATGEMALASTLMIMTLPINEKVRLNVNAGWSYVATTDIPNALFYGGQFEMDVAQDVQLMVEAFGRSPGVPGMQMGLRYTPRNGPIDYDLLVGNFFDDGTTRFITLGVTLRY